MAQERNLFVHTGAQSPETAFVVSERYPVPVPEVFDFVYGDQVKLELFLVNGQGGFDAVSGLSGYTVKVAIGPLAGTVAALQDSWGLITNGWSATLELNTAGALALLAGQNTVETWLEVEITDGSGNVRTYGQTQIRLRNQTINSGASVPTPAADYFTKTETNQKFIQNQSALTALTGGSATDLDGIATVNVAVGPILAVVLGQVLSYYQLFDGTDAESSPHVIRPDDYAASTNEKVWKLVKQAITGYEHVQASPLSVWPVNHQLGYRPSSYLLWIGDVASLAKIAHVDNDNLTVTLNSNQSGTFKCF